MTPLDRTEFARWRSEAEKALEIARPTADREVFNWSSFLAEQAAQLGVKALMHGLGRAPWGHDLEKLATMLEEADVPPPRHLRDAMLVLSRFYIAARYPDAHPGGAVGAHFSRRDADQAIADAESILAWVDQTWESLQ